METWHASPVEGVSWSRHRPRWAAAEAPRSMGRLGRVPGQVLPDSALPEVPVPAPSPWLPHVAAEAPSDPGGPLLKDRLPCCTAAGRVPPLERPSQVLHDSRDCYPACPARPWTSLLRERLPSLLPDQASGRPTPGAREARKRPAPGAVHCPCGRVDRALHLSLQAPRHPGPYALAGP
jgi:hypothetical protein